MSTKSTFVSTAQAVTVQVGTQPLRAEPREFSSGSLGWYAHGKSTAAAGRPLSLQVEGQTVTAAWRQFSSGSWGWFVAGKVQVQGFKVQVSGNVTCVKSKEWEHVPAEGEEVKVQVGLNLTCVKSKEWAA